MSKSRLSPEEKLQKATTDAMSAIEHYDQKQQTGISLGEGWIWRNSYYSEDKGAPSAQLRIAIHPEKENALKAYQTLLETYKNDNVTLKMYSPATFKTHVGFDATLCELPESEREVKDPLIDILLPMASDRHQCGKEVCIYFYSAVDSADPDYWKDFILRGWAALQSAGIIIGYAKPFSDTEIATDDDLFIPFTFAAEVHWKKRHGVLFSDDVLNPENPFKDIRITSYDLAQYGIDKSYVAELKQNRYEYYLGEKSPLLKQGLARLKNLIENIPDENAAITTTMRRLNEIAAQLLAESKLDESTLTSLKSELVELSKKMQYIFPRNAEYDAEIDRGGELLAVVPSLTEVCLRYLNTYGDVNKKSFNLEALKQIKIYQPLIEKTYHYEMAATEKDYLSCDLTRDWLTKEGLINDLKAAISKQPYLMQCVFRKLVHCLREKQFAEYLGHKEKLENIIANLKQQHNDNLIQAINHLQQLLIQVEQARQASRDTKTALAILKSTHDIITCPTPENKANHDSLADTVNGKPFWRNAAWMMLLIGAAAFGIAALITTSVITAGATTAAYAVVSGAASTVISLGLFAHGRRKDLSKTMIDVNDDANIFTCTRTV